MTVHIRRITRLFFAGLLLLLLLFHEAVTAASQAVTVAPASSNYELRITNYESASHLLPARQATVRPSAFSEPCLTGRVRDPFSAPDRTKRKDGSIADQPEQYWLITTSFSVRKQLLPIIDSVHELADDGVLSKGQAHTLELTLRAAMEQAAKGNLGPAVERLTAFHIQVRILVRQAVLSPEQAFSLLDPAGALLESLRQPGLILSQAIVLLPEDSDEPAAVTLVEFSEQRSRTQILLAVWPWLMLLLASLSLIGYVLQWRRGLLSH